MDYRPNYYSNRNAIDKSNRYKKKKIFWLNSSFNSDFVLIDNKIYEISWDIPPFEIYKNNRLKLLTYIRDSNQSKPIQIKLKLPSTQSRDIINTDKEAFPIIYTNHSAVEAMTYGSNPIIRLIPQQITRFTFRLDDNYSQLDYNSYFTSITNGSVFQVAGGSPDDKYIIFNSSGSFVLDKNLNCDILVVGGGGGGGFFGAGGGAGQVLYTTNLNLNLGTYTITVGSGGAGSSTSSTNGSNGNDSSITIGGFTYIAKGGGGGGTRQANSVGRAGNDGGSGGGGSHSDSSTSVNVGGSSTKNTYNNWISLGNSGGDGKDGNDGGYGHGGGGGAGSSGENGKINGGGAGGRGINLSSIFGSSVGQAGWFGGGGGGTAFSGVQGATIGFANGGNGLFGGGGNGSIGAVNGINGLANTGGGGGGSDIYAIGGNGGSGVVIIKFKEIRNEGITAEENLIQATNNSITVNTDSKYVINYQNPVNIPKGTYETIFENGAILFRDKKFPRPWGAYFAEDWSGTTLLDSSGNGRHATTGGTITKASGFGNGANGNITYISGGTSSIITWPANSIPSTYTILGLTRYTGAWKRRILQGSANWIQGHWDNNVNSTGIRGVAFNTTTFLTPTTSVGNITDWLCSITKNSGTTPNNAIMDGVGRGITTSASGGYILGINTGAFGASKASDWAMSVVLIWDTALSDDQMFELNRLIDDYKNTGRSIKNDLGLNFDYSYPILKDANNATINPLVWYKFDGSTAGLINDSSGNNYTLTNTGVVINKNIFIKGDGSANFVGLAANYFDMPTTIDFNAINIATGISFTCWFKINPATQSYCPIFQFGTTANSGANDSRYVGFNRFTGNNIRFFNVNTTTDGTLIGQTSDAVVLSDVNYADGTWRHITWTFSTSGYVNIYINGVNKYASQWSVIAPFTVNKVNRIGNLIVNGNNTIDGNIDDFRIYPLQLSATQVSELYNGRLSIYNPPAFLTGFELEDEDLFKENTISSYK